MHHQRFPWTPLTIVTKSYVHSLMHSCTTTSNLPEYHSSSSSVCTHNTPLYNTFIHSSICSISHSFLHFLYNSCMLSFTQLFHLASHVLVGHVRSWLGTQFTDPKHNVQSQSTMYSPKAGLHDRASYRICCHALVEFIDKYRLLVIRHIRNIDADIGKNTSGNQSNMWSLKYRRVSWLIPSNLFCVLWITPGAAWQIFRNSKQYMNTQVRRRQHIQ